MVVAPADVKKGDVIASYAPDDDESAFWLGRCDADGEFAGEPNDVCSMTWLEFAGEDGEYEVGGPQEGGIGWKTIICVVRSGWDGVRADGENFHLSDVEKRAIAQAIEAAAADASSSDEEEGAAAAGGGAAAAAPPAAAPVIVAADGAMEFKDKANSFTECTVALRPELAGAKQAFPPKPGFEFSSPSQFHQFVGDAIPRLPGCVLIKTLLDEKSALFKAARKLLLSTTATFDKFYDHFQEVESHLGAGWMRRLVFDEPFKVLKNLAGDGPQSATITVKQGGYGILDVEEEGEGGGAKKSKAKKKKEEAEEPVVWETRKVTMEQDQAAYAIAWDALKTNTSSPKVKRVNGKVCWELKEDTATGYPMVTGFTDSKSDVAKKFQKKIGYVIIGVEKTAVKTIAEVEAAVKAATKPAVQVTVWSGIPSFGRKHLSEDTAKEAGSMKKYGLKSLGGKIGYGWQLKDDDEGRAVISKLPKKPDGSKGPAAENDIALKGIIHAVGGKPVKGVAEVNRALAKLQGKKVRAPPPSHHSLCQATTGCCNPCKHLTAVGLF